MKVTAVRTPYQPAELARVVVSLRPDIAREPLALAVAQTSWETGQGRSCFNFNPGNVSASKYYSGDYIAAPWVDNPSHPGYGEWAAGRAPSGFRAYADLTAGVKDYLTAVEVWCPEVAKAWNTGDCQQVFAAIRHRYTPDRLSAAREAEARANFCQLYQAALRMPEVASRPPLPRVSLGEGLAAGVTVVGLVGAIAWAVVRYVLPEVLGRGRR